MRASDAPRPREIDAAFNRYLANRQPEAASAGQPGWQSVKSGLTLILLGNAALIVIGAVMGGLYGYGAGEAEMAIATTAAFFAGMLMLLGNGFCLRVPAESGLRGLVGWAFFCFFIGAIGSAICGIAYLSSAFGWQIPLADTLMAFWYAFAGVGALASAIGGLLFFIFLRGIGTVAGDASLTASAGWGMFLYLLVTVGGTIFGFTATPDFTDLGTIWGQGFATIGAILSLIYMVVYLRTVVLARSAAGTLAAA